MDPLELTARLTAFEGRGPGSDAERRAARWLARELSGAGRRPAIETFWCRPNWALAHAWHVALALAGSLLSISHPTVGAVLLATALASILADELTGISLGRRLTPERASQNVVLEGPPDKPSTLIVTANYDTPRAALVYRDALRRPTAALRQTAGPFAIGWLGWLSIAVVWLLAIAAVRITSHNPPSLLGAIQLPPSVALVLALALLLEAAGAGYESTAGDNPSGTAVAVELVRALGANPPRNLSVDLLLQGAGAGHEIGLRRYLKRHARELSAERAIVLGVAPCGAGDLHWWRSDGRLIPIAYTRRLHQLAHEAAGDRAQAHRGRAATPALPARVRTRPLPAIAIGNLDRLGLAGEGPDVAGLDQAVGFGVLLVEAIDEALDQDRARVDPAATPA